MRTSLLLLSILLSLNLFSQKKVEREFRLKTDEVPEKALHFIDNAESAKIKVKWYFEENLKGNSVEAKFVYESKRYSVEFDTLGNLQDIEVEISIDSIEKQVQERIQVYLKDQFEKFTIQKIQLQYIEVRKNFSEHLQMAQSEIEVKYEIVVKGRQEKKWKLFEVTFNKEGDPEDQVEIVLRNTDNLEY